MTETTPETETMIETTDEATIKTEATNTETTDDVTTNTETTDASEVEATEPVGDERIAKLSAEAKQNRLRAKEAEAERDKTQALLTTLRARVLAEHVVKAGRVRQDAATAVVDEIIHDPAIFTETGDLDTETVKRLLSALRDTKRYYFEASWHLNPGGDPSESRRRKPAQPPLQAAVDKALHYNRGM